MAIDILPPSIDPSLNSPFLVQGLVTTKDNSAIDQAGIKIKDNANGNEIDALSGPLGRYNIIIDPLGSEDLTLEVSKPGYQTFKAKIQRGAAEFNIILFREQVFSIVAGETKDVFGNTLSTVEVGAENTTINNTSSNAEGEYQVEVPRSVERIVFSKTGGFETLFVANLKKFFD